MKYRLDYSSYVSFIFIYDDETGVVEYKLNSGSCLFLKCLPLDNADFYKLRLAMHDERQLLCHYTVQYNEVDSVCFRMVLDLLSDAKTLRVCWLYSDRNLDWKMRSIFGVAGFVHSHMSALNSCIKIEIPIKMGLYLLNLKSRHAEELVHQFDGLMSRGLDRMFENVKTGSCKLKSINWG